MKNKKIYLLIATLVSAIGAFAQDYQQAYRDVQQQFEQRLATAPSVLETYLADFPYSVYEDEIHTMRAVLYAEKKQYKSAIHAFDKVNPKNLSRSSEPMYHFYLGYTHLQLQNYDKARASMQRIKDAQSAYSLQAKYYTGYCCYIKQEYQQALVEFLALEHIGGYDQVAPYYIVQIY